MPKPELEFFPVDSIPSSLFLALHLVIISAS